MYVLRCTSIIRLSKYLSVNRTVNKYYKSSSTTHLWRRRRERRCSSYSFTTSALEGSEWSVSCPGKKYYTESLITLKQ
jgi:hypothetical protein